MNLTLIYALKGVEILRLTMPVFTISYLQGDSTCAHR